MPAERASRQPSETEARTREEAIGYLRGWRKARAGNGALEDCSLVVPTFRRPSEVLTLLATVAGLPDPPAEVAVVDGSPGYELEAPLRAWVRPQVLPFELLYVKAPTGLTRQRNVGIDLTTREFVFFLDDDCQPLPGYFEAIRTVFAEDGRGEVGAVSGSIESEMGRPLTWRWRLRLLLRLVPHGAPGQYHPTATSWPRSLIAPFRGARPVAVIPGGACAFRRVVFQGHRFSSFFSGYAQGEDLEMSLRIGRQWQLRWCGDARLLHHHSPRARLAGFRKGRMEVRNRVFIWRRHSPAVRWVDRVRFWLDIAYILSYDLASFIARPWRLRLLAHAAGVLAGALECLVVPPRHQEPPARREYAFALERLR